MTAINRGHDGCSDCEGHAILVFGPVLADFALPTPRLSLLKRKWRLGHAAMSVRAERKVGNMLFVARHPVWLVESCVSHRSGSVGH
jgi:hypothetical protein